MADETSSQPAPAPDAPKDAAPEAARAVPAAPPARPPLSFLVIVSLLNLVADLGSKWWAVTRLDEPLGIRRIEVIKGHLGFVFAKNKGGAWGLLQDENDSIRRPFFLLISAAAVIFIVSLYRRLQPDQLALKWGLPLVLGGALGNLVDRIRYGYVVDFIDVRLTRTFTWPTFNVADIAICVGVGLMAIDMFTSRKKSPAHVAELEAELHSTARPTPEAAPEPAPPPEAAGEPAPPAEPAAPPAAKET